MIRLAKGPKPNVLVSNAEDWTRELLEKLANGEDVSDTIKGRYRHREIKTALIDETREKCAYCESKVRHIAHGDIEHISPKSIHPELTFEWDNLTFACPICNGNKSNKEGFVDPYDCEPMDHFFFDGPLLFSNPGNEMAKYTEITIDLNRFELVEKRKERISNLHQQIDNLAKTQNVKLKAILKDDIVNNETADDIEYAALSRHFVAKCIERLEAPP